MTRRIILIGATGVFGARLARLIAPWPDASLVLAARREGPLMALAAELGEDVEVAVFDRDRPEGLARLRPWAVVDAAGPFQGAGYDLALSAVAAGAHYVDLADGRAFVAGFESAADAAARAQGVLAVTGASSTPALTQAALDRLTTGWTRIDSAASAISAGARAPKGASLLRAILSWTGRPVRVFADGGWRERPGWSDMRRVNIPGVGPRRVALAETADLDLIPARARPRREGVFHAGVEPSAAQWAMWWLAWLVRMRLARALTAFAPLLSRIGALTANLGSDRSGMVVQVEGLGPDGAPRLSRWALWAEPGAGPTTPAAPAAAVLRALLDGRLVRTGATACVDLLPIEDLVAPLAHLPIRTRIDETRPAARGLFPRLLGPAFEVLPPEVRAAHDGAATIRFQGIAVARGSRGPATMVRTALGLPGRGRHAAAVEIAPAGDGERWTRRFGAQRFQTRLRPVGDDLGAFEETAGPITFRFRAEPVRNGFVWRFDGWRLGPAPLPRALAPRIRARTFARDGAYRFSVLAAHPWAGVLFAYAGRLKPA